MAILLRNADLYRTSVRSFAMGDVLIENGRIERITVETPIDPPAGAEVYDLDGQRLLPGFVDVHTHGRVGGDFVTADTEKMKVMSRSYLDSGVTTVMPTLASAPFEDMQTAIDRIHALADYENAENAAGRAGSAHIAGVHLEGRYLNPAKRGAHAPSLLSALDPAELDILLPRIHGAAHITAALELDESGAFLRRALELGATVSLGHTMADYDTASALLTKGVTAVTHMFNAMPPVHHRDGGAVVAGMLSDHAFCELICDGFHIAPHMVKLAYRMVGERLVLITDSMEATGAADGEYSIAGMPVTVKDGKARTHDGAIAGSTLSMWPAVCNLVDFAGIPLECAIYAATMAPALEIGLQNEIGSIDEGKRADFVLLDRSGREIERVMCGGIWNR